MRNGEIEEIHESTRRQSSLRRILSRLVRVNRRVYSAFHGEKPRKQTVQKRTTSVKNQMEQGEYPKIVHPEDLNSLHYWLSKFTTNSATEDMATQALTDVETQGLNLPISVYEKYLTMVTNWRDKYMGR